MISNIMLNFCQAYDWWSAYTRSCFSVINLTKNRKFIKPTMIKFL